jgi:predicted outer membrane protein
MNRLRHALLITYVIASQGFAQSTASLVSLTSLEAEEKNSDVEDADSYGTDQFLSYSLKASLAKRSLARLATTQGSCAEIRSLGKEMLKVEDSAMEELRRLAAKRGLYASDTKPENLQERSANLPSEQSVEFDKKFVSEAIRLLEHDVDMLRRGSECDDRWVRLMASDQLVRVEHHLAQLRLIREKTN